MKSEIEAAIVELAAKAKGASTAHEAMQFSQAVSNLAHALVTINPIK